MLGPQPVAAEDCKAVVLQAAEAGIIDVDGFGPQGVRILVDEDFWRSTELGTKRGMLNAIECALVDGDERLLMEVRSKSDGRLLARRTATDDYVPADEQ